MLTLEQALAWIRRSEEVMAENKDRLTALDAAIGDADHGVNICRGFTAVKESLEKEPPSTIAALLKTAGMSLIRSVGGASGPLYGTFFIRAGAAAVGKDTLDPVAVRVMLEAGVAGILERGKASPGDKTMIDAWTPALAAVAQAQEANATVHEMAARAAEGAEQGMNATTPLLARKGRASYLGERSQGHTDPGATSTWLLLRCAAETW